MVHIKLSATFVLAAAVIAPVVAQPVRQDVSGSANAVHLEPHHGSHELSRSSHVSSSENVGHHHIQHGLHAPGGSSANSPDSSPGDVPPEYVAPSRRESVDSLGIRDIPGPTTSENPPTPLVPGEADSQDSEHPKQLELKPRRQRSQRRQRRQRSHGRYRTPTGLRGRLSRQPAPSPLMDEPSPTTSTPSRREYIDIQDLVERSLDELEFEARDFADFDDLRARYFEDEFYLD